MGRPPELTDELLTRLKAAFAKGLTREQAASVAGVARSTLYVWLAEGDRLIERSEFTGGPVAMVAGLKAEDILRPHLANPYGRAFTGNARRSMELALAAKLDRMTLRKRRRKAGRARHGR